MEKSKSHRREKAKLQISMDYCASSRQATTWACRALARAKWEAKDRGDNEVEYSFWIQKFQSHSEMWFVSGKWAFAITRVICWYLSRQVLLNLLNSNSLILRENLLVQTSLEIPFCMQMGKEEACFRSTDVTDIAKQRKMKVCWEKPNVG